MDDMRNKKEIDTLFLEVIDLITIFDLTFLYLK